MSGCIAGIQRLEQTSRRVPPGSRGKAGCWAPPLSPPWGAGDRPSQVPLAAPRQPQRRGRLLCFVPPRLGHRLRCFVGDSPPSAVLTLVLGGLSHPGAGGFQATPAGQCLPPPGDGGILAVTPHQHSLLPWRWRGPFPPGGACRLKMEPLPCNCSPARSPRGPDSVLSCSRGVQSGSVSGEHAGRRAQPPRGVREGLSSAWRCASAACHAARSAAAPLSCALRRVGGLRAGAERRARGGGHRAAGQVGADVPPAPLGGCLPPAVASEMGMGAANAQRGGTAV